MLLVKFLFIDVAKQSMLSGYQEVIGLFQKKTKQGGEGRRVEDMGYTRNMRNLRNFHEYQRNSMWNF